MLNYGESSQQATEIMKSVALVLVDTLKSRSAAMAHSELNDPLIDI